MTLAVLYENQNSLPLWVNLGEVGWDECPLTTFTHLGVVYIIFYSVSHTNTSIHVTHSHTHTHVQCGRDQTQDLRYPWQKEHHLLCFLSHVFILWRDALGSKIE